MAIAPKLPQIVTAARPGALQALALQAGQMVEGQVIGPAPNGGTQVQIASQMLNLILPTLVAAGDKLMFGVQGTGSQIKLTMQIGTQTPAPTPSGQPAQMAPTTFLPLPPQPVLPPALNASAQVVTSAAAGPTPAVLSTAGAGQPAAADGPDYLAVTSVTAKPQLTSTALPSVSASVPATSTTTDTAHVALNSGPPVPTPGGGPPIPAVRPSSPYPPMQAMVKAQPEGQLAQLTADRAILATAPVSKASPVAATAAPPRHASAATPPIATNAPAQTLTPKAALGQMVQTALPQQDSAAALMTALTMIAGKIALPEPVVRAAQLVLAGRMAIDPGRLDGATLQKAVLSSGVFHEAHLAQGNATAAQGDQKGALLALRQTLLHWLGPQSAVAPAAHIAPPVRGQVARARATEAAPPHLTAAPEEIGKQLLERTEASLSRLRLHQNASLPEPTAKATADWSMDLPIIAGTQQTVLHIQIHRDDSSAPDARAERGWQMRFAMSMPQMGEVGAQVSLRGGATGVMLWASEPDTSSALEGHLVALRQTLSEIGLRPGTIVVRHGEPPAPPAASGHILDESR